ncbi:MAG TPA: helix-turn-helix domain-containing protein, partial [Devosia sp.]|nr:helix-turn-helix domain-containing protein [Devosia sp.]
MDALIAAAARALATGDILGALNRVALRDDGPALALRGIAMAQLGDLARAKALLKSAAQAFGPKEAVARARCIVAEAEIAFVSRELSWPVATLAAARTTLEQRGDPINAIHALHLEVRRMLLLGQLDDAEHRLGAPPSTPLPPALIAAHHMIAAGIAMRRLQAAPA